jgi:hypothetical protein
MSSALTEEEEEEEEWPGSAPVHWLYMQTKHPL